MWIDEETRELLHNQPKLLAVVEEVMRHRDGLANTLGRGAGVFTPPCERKQR